GEWDSLIDYLENQTAKTDEGRAIIAEWIAQAKALNCPTSIADQSGVIGALTDLLSWFDSGPSQWGPWIIRAGEGGCDDAVEAARQAL
ncbi:hypothetical protein ABTG62_18645, partial [Acinetobacter baumannii]